LLGAATKQRATAVKQLNVILSKQRTDTFTAATVEYDTILAKLAKTISEVLPELAAAKSAWTRTNRQSMDANKIIPELPTPPEPVVEPIGNTAYFKMVPR